MPHGLLCVGTSTSYQIDGYNKSLGLIKKQSFQCPKGNLLPGGNHADTPFPNPVSSNTKLIAATSNSWVRIGGNAYGRNATVLQPWEGPAAYVNIWEFGDTPINYWKQKTGVVVLNPDTGQVVYNSNWGVLKVLYTNIVQIWPQNLWTYTLPNDGKSYAFCIGGGTQSRFEDGDFGEWWSYYWRLNGRTLEVKWLMDTQYRSPSYWNDQSQIPLFLMIIDVTGM